MYVRNWGLEQVDDKIFSKWKNRDFSSSSDFIGRILLSLVLIGSHDL